MIVMKMILITNVIVVMKIVKKEKLEKVKKE